jgi:16S rRNA (cytosine1402-N4)-methyltransferase
MFAGHIPVLLQEVINYLQPYPGDNFIDGTLGGGGHALALAEKIYPDGKILAIDQDQSTIDRFKKEINQTKFNGNVVLVNDNFKKLKQITTNVLPNTSFTGIVLDLGLSSDQLQDPKKGFGFVAKTLDMRLDPSQDLTAAVIINKCNEAELIDIFKNYGEERLAKPIAKSIISARKIAPIVAPPRLIGLITEVYAKFYHRPSKINPATKVFQALRLAVNDELKNLQVVLPQAVEALKVGGRIAVISFHSLEDRIVKNFFRDAARQDSPTLKIITKKPIIPTFEEIKNNPRSRSAKLRVAERI